jgi:hypothetical protein
MSIDWRLIEIFNTTLASLPPAARKKIETFWRSQGVQENGGQFSLPIRKLPNLGSKSQCANTDGVIFNFKSALVDQAPEAMLRIAIAHELTHAYRSAELGMPLNEATAHGYTSRDKEEDEANRLMKNWGFDPAPLLNWLTEHKDALDLD